VLNWASLISWALIQANCSLGVGMGGNGSHIGATANVYMVTISERLARESGNPDLAITPALWLRKGTPVTWVALVICSVFIGLGYDFLYVA
jgi:Na+/H+ antiporter NhaD/arsenite permease-like protein